MTNLLTWVLGVSAGVLLALAGEPYMKRHPLAGCWFWAVLTVVLAAPAAANAVLGQWWWTALQIVLTFTSAWEWLRYRDRRKQAKAAQQPEMIP